MANIDTCIICGHPIWSDESLARGYGSECASLLKTVIKEKFFANKKYSLTYNWLIQVNIFKKAFVEAYKNVKFRSSFRKSFYESIKNRDRISRKQLDIIIDLLRSKDVDVSELYDQIDHEKRIYFESKCKKEKYTANDQEIFLAILLAISLLAI